jgi:flagellar basal-body rod modification protein FlgD
MNVTQVAAAATPQSSPPASNELNGDSFITLLTAQLKAQDPMNPMDPTQFITQLVQFNQLQQTIEIRQILQGTPSSANTDPAAPPTPGGM